MKIAFRIGLLLLSAVPALRTETAFAQRFNERMNLDPRSQTEVILQGAAGMRMGGGVSMAPQAIISSRTTGEMLPTLNAVPSIQSRGCNQIVGSVTPASKGVPGGSTQVTVSGTSFVNFCNSR